MRSVITRPLALAGILTVLSACSGASATARTSGSADVPSVGAAPAPSAPGAMRALLDAHNQRRAEHCAPPLAWSPELAATAQAWADSLRDRGCAFEHSQSNLGENLAAGTEGTLDGEAVTEMWYAEVRGFDFRRGGFSMETGHFTQVVWAATERVGCGIAQCNGMDVWVCNYDPPGNLEGAYRENVRPTSCR